MAFLPLPHISIFPPQCLKLEEISWYSADLKESQGTKEKQFSCYSDKSATLE